jgi:hypothetical protein
MELDLIFSYMEDNLIYQKIKKTSIVLELEDNYNFFLNGRRPLFFLNGRPGRYFPRGRTGIARRKSLISQEIVMKPAINSSLLKKNNSDQLYSL